jgi:ketosteroid isomerase-like protein
LTDAQRVAITSEVNQAIDELFEARNTHDVDRLLTYYLDEDDFAYVGLVDVKSGRGAFNQITRLWHRANPHVTFQHQILHTQVLSPTSALVVSRGSTTDVEVLTWTHVLTRDDRGRWVIAHEHEAWPHCGDVPKPHPMTAEP